MAKKNWPERPKSLSERGYRKYMARQKKVTVNGTEFTLQSVSPSWYYETNDECGNTGSGKRKSAEYMDRMFKNCVIAPAEVRNEGMAYFDEKDDLKTPEGLIKAIENFLRECGQRSRSAAAGPAEQGILVHGVRRQRHHLLRAQRNGLERVPGSRRGPLAVARRMEPQQKEIAVPSGAAISAFKEVKTWQTQETSPMA